MNIPNGLTILGLGSIGAAMTGRLQKMLNGSSVPLRLIAVDTDRRRMENCGLPPEDRLTAAPDWRNGRGCGGDVLEGQRALAHERSKIENLIGHPEFLLVVAAFGGGTATGGAGIIQSICRKNDIPVIYLVTLPFAQEGHSRRQAAEDAIRQELLGAADAVLALPNDLLYSILPATTPVLQAYEMADQEFAATAAGIARLLTQNNLLAPDVAELSAILHRKKSFCSIGVGHAARTDGPDAGLCAMEKMLSSPLLGGANKIKEADAVIFSFMGGSDLSIGEVRQTLNAALEYTGSGARILSGASVDPALGDQVMICCITVKFEEESDTAVQLPVHDAPAEKPVRRTRNTRNRSKHADDGQQFFAFESLSKGIMEKTQPVLWNGEDLDDPTWRRRNAQFEKGTEITIGK